MKTALLSPSQINGVHNQRANNISFSPGARSVYSVHKHGVTKGLTLTWLYINNPAIVDKRLPRPSPLPPRVNICLRYFKSSTQIW